MAEAAKEVEVIETTEVIEETKFSLETYEKSKQESASKNGWKDYDEYVESGGDPEKWRPAGEFLLYGEMVGEMKRTRQEIDDRVENVKHLVQAKAQIEIDRLTAERDSLIEEGGRGAEVKVIDKQIQKLNTQPVNTSASPVHEWNERNPWVKEMTPKAAFARETFRALQNQGYTDAAALPILEAEIKKQFPPAARQAHIPETEKGNGSKGFVEKGSKAATMETLTEEERAIWGHSSSMWKGDKKAFLQSVNDIRKGAKA